MTILHYANVFRALDKHVKTHNNNTKTLSQRIRQSTASTARDILRIYGISLLKANRIQTIDKANPPSLRTNNVQLAKMANASPRTIQRHIKRLIDAKIIIRKLWHGSRSSYELWLHPDILLINLEQAVDNLKTTPARSGLKVTDNQFFKKEITTTCRHTDTSNTNYINNNIIIAVDKSKPIKNYHPTTLIGALVSKKGFKGYTERKDAEKNNAAEGKARIKRVTKSTSAEMLDIEVTRSATLNGYAQKLWQLARASIYKNVLLTENQVETAHKLLLLWYAPVPNSRLENVHKIYVERLKIVQRYIEKDPVNRYVQLPYTYFDPKNTHGFAGTKAWYDNQKRKQAKTRVQLFLKSQIQQFINNEAKDTPYQKPRLALLKACENRLQKLGNPDLIKQFHASVLNLNTTKYLSLNT